MQRNKENEQDWVLFKGDNMLLVFLINQSTGQPDEHANQIDHRRQDHFSTHVLIKLLQLYYSLYIGAHGMHMFKWS